MISSMIKDNFVLGGHKAVAVSKVISDRKVLLYSEFDKLQTADMGFGKLDDIQGYLDKRIKDDSSIKITVVPSGRFARVQK